MSTNNAFLIVGRSFSNTLNSIRRRGDNYIILKDTDNTVSDSEVAVNFLDQAALIQAVDKLAGKVNGVFWTYENYVLPAAIIAKRLGLPGMPISSAKKCTDKFLMRQAFAQVSEPISTDFSLITDEASLISFAHEHDYPLIIKPANLTKSLLVSKSNNQAELIKNYQKTLGLVDKTYKRYARGRNPKLVVEEFLAGPAHSVEAFTDNEGNVYVLEQIVDYQTGYDIGYDDNFHYSRLIPSQLTQSKQSELRHVAKLGVKALGMRNSPAHVEIIYTKKGPRIIEIGARKGGYRERMHRLANGLDLDKVSLDLVLGQKPKIKALKNEPCATLELFPKTPGKFDGIHNEDAVKKLPSLIYLSVKKDPGEQVGKSSDGFKMCAIIMLHNKDEKQFKEDLNFVNGEVYVKTT